MMQITFDTGNAAFYAEDGSFNPLEVADILRKLAAKVERGELEGRIHDTNGNKVGGWDLTYAEPDVENEQNPTGKLWGLFERYGYNSEKLVSTWDTYYDAWCAYGEQYTAHEAEELGVEIAKWTGFSWTMDY